MAAENLTTNWQPWPPPQNGFWVIALCNDGSTIMRVSWGRDRQDKLAWCSADASYGDGLFQGWIPWPGALAGDPLGTLRDAV